MRVFGIGFVAVGVAALVGCGSQIGEENAYGCLEDSREPVAGDVVPDGFSETPDAALARLVGDFTGSSDLATGDTALSVAVTGGAEVVRRSWRSEGGDGDIEPAMEPAIGECPDILAFPATVALVVDGSLDEAGEVELQITEGGAALAWLTVDHAEKGGAAEPSFDPATKTAVELHVDLAHDGTSWSGAARWFYEDPPSGSGDDATVSAGIEEMFEFTLDPVVP